jgi:hypothetical protein
MPTPETTTPPTLLGVLGVRGERAAWHEFHKKFRTGQRSTYDYMSRSGPRPLARHARGAGARLPR